MTIHKTEHTLSCSLSFIKAHTNTHVYIKNTVYKREVQTKQQKNFLNEEKIFRRKTF